MNNKVITIMGVLLTIASLFLGLILTVKFGVISFSNEYYGWGAFYVILLIAVIPFTIVGLGACIWNSFQHADGTPYTEAELDELAEEDKMDKEHELKKIELENNKPKSS